MTVGWYFDILIILLVSANVINQKLDFVRCYMIVIHLYYIKISRNSVYCLKNVKFYWKTFNYLWIQDSTKTFTIKIYLQKNHL